MTAKRLVPVLVLAASMGALLLGGAAARADDYRPEEFFRLDLNKAALSPKPLGPPARFEPVPVEAKADQARVEEAKPRPVARTARALLAKPQAGPRRKLARSRGNPLDAQASDTRIQVWPCRSGGICNWSKPPR
ncbi:MAG TPA: hypothetical protein VIQ05_14975 [Tardiphaga sp.]